MIFEWLAHKMVGRNLRLIRRGRSHRWWFVAFWVSFAAYVLTSWKSLEIATFILLVCAVIARIMARSRGPGELKELLAEENKSDKHK